MSNSFFGSLILGVAAAGYAVGRQLKGDAEKREMERRRIQTEMVNIKPLIKLAGPRLLGEYRMKRLSNSMVISILRDVVISNVGHTRWLAVSGDHALSQEAIKQSTDHARRLSELEEPARNKRLYIVRDKIFTRNDMRDFFGRVYVNASHGDYDRKSQIFDAFCRVAGAADEQLQEIVTATESDLIFKDQLISVLVLESKNSTQEARLIRRVDCSGEMSGLEFEELCRDILIFNGWSVRETKKTGDQGVDLIAMYNQEKICLQCKRQSASVGNSAVQQVHAGQSFYKCKQAYVVSNASYTSSAVELSSAAGVKLLNVKELLQLKPQR